LEIPDVKVVMTSLGGEVIFDPDRLTVTK